MDSHRLPRDEGGVYRNEECPPHGLYYRSQPVPVLLILSFSAVFYYLSVGLSFLILYISLSSGSHSMSVSPLLFSLLVSPHSLSLCPSLLTHFCVSPHSSLSQSHSLSSPTFCASLSSLILSASLSPVSLSLPLTLLQFSLPVSSVTTTAATFTHTTASTHCL